MVIDEILMLSDAWIAVLQMLFSCNVIFHEKRFQIINRGYYCGVDGDNFFHENYNLGSKSRQFYQKVDRRTLHLLRRSKYCGLWHM